MASIFETQAQQDLRTRMSQLRPGLTPKWGKMSVSQMQIHLIDALRMATGELACRPKPSPLKNALGRWLVIYSPLPWPKGAPTAPELLARASANFDAEQRDLLDTFDHVVQAGQNLPWAEHPAFGHLTTKDWGTLIWRHTDHHLKQFGL
jgi:hypothetical protein